MTEIDKKAKKRIPWNKGKHIGSPERTAKFRESMSKVWTPEKRKSQRDKQKEIWSDPELLKKHSEIAKKGMTEEKKQRIAESLREYNAKVSSEEWTKRYLKGMETKLEHGISYSSQDEMTVRNFIKELGFEPTKYCIGKGTTRFEIDIYIPEKKIGIEYNGIYYHSRNGINHYPVNYHFKKSCVAAELEIDLIQIWEDQWKNNTSLIKDILKTRLGVNSNKRIYARDCVIKEVDNETYKTFCNDNHMQGYRPANIRLGLYYRDTLVQLASFGRARSYVKSSFECWEYEWIRGATLKGYSVIGGTSKLFKSFITTYDPTNVLCYCDWNYFNGKSYEKCGFRFIDRTGPDLFFIKNSSSLERINRNPSKNSEHKQLVVQNLLYECHGCGSKKYGWFKD